MEPLLAIDVADEVISRMAARFSSFSVPLSTPIYQEETGPEHRALLNEPLV